MEPVSGILGLPPLPSVRITVAAARTRVRSLAPLGHEAHHDLAALAAGENYVSTAIDHREVAAIAALDA